MHPDIQAAHRILNGHAHVTPVMTSTTLDRMIDDRAGRRSRPPAGALRRRGLLSGCAIAAKAESPRCRIIGVEPNLGDDATRSFRLW